MAVIALLAGMLAAPTAYASIIVGDQYTAYAAHECRGKRPRPVARQVQRPPELICAQWVEDRCVARRVQMHWRAE